MNTIILSYILLKLPSALYALYAKYKSSLKSWNLFFNQPNQKTMNYPNKMTTTGDKDAAVVKRIQIVLNTLGCGPVFEDGIFGEKTLQSVKEFQSKHCDEQGLPLKVDGKVGPKTWWSLDQNLTNFVNSHAALR